MKYPRTAEGYAAYIRSEHWAKLRGAVLRRDGNHCVRCGSTERLSAHHKVYREDWEGQSTADLETLCWPCHEKEHPEKHAQVTITVTVHPVPVPMEGIGLVTRKDVERARSNRQISRKQYLELRDRIWGKAVRRKNGRKWRAMRRGKPKRKVRHRQGCSPWHYNPNYRKQWVNRGTSSN